MPAPAILLRILFLYKLLNGILLYLIPKKLRAYLPSSWYPPQPKTKPTTTATTLLSSPPFSSSPPPRALFPGMDSHELCRVFQMFDRNGDGRITKKELHDSLENMGIFIPDNELDLMIANIDVNGDGSVDIEEFGCLYQSLLDERSEEDDMKEAFDVFDRNGDGFISLEELKVVLASIGLKQGRTAEDCKRMITKVDVDGDGMVNFHEFKQMMRGGGFAALS